MPTITFMPDGKQANAEIGDVLFDVMKREGLSIVSPCGGYGVCGKCLVKVASGKVDFDNSGIVPESLTKEGFVLACRSKVLNEPVVLEAVAKEEKEVGKFLNMTEEMHLIDEALLPGPDEMDFIVKKLNIQVAEPESGDGLSDFDRFKTAAAEAIGTSNITLPIRILRYLPQLIRNFNGAITIFYYKAGDIGHIVSVEDDDTQAKFGIAIDIGTTTVAVQLVDLVTGVIVGSKTDYNGQIECGLDIISRINYARKHDRLEELRKKVIITINGILGGLLQHIHQKPEAVLCASVAANPTMVHLFMGIIPEYIRLSPYTPALYTSPLFKGGELGLRVNSNAPVFIAPSVGSYVGGDITAGLLSTSLSTESEELCLFIDIGTNGEIVIGNNEFLMGCACSAGPAFEGGGIKSGMRASTGAIERVEVDAETGAPTIHTIGNLPPVGICGSGIISVIAQLLETGWIDPAGRFNRNRPCEYLDFSEKNGKYMLYHGSNALNRKPVVITEADIENVMRAKAAIYSACRTLLLSISMDFSDLTRIYVAGGFGRYLDVHNCHTIGLLPSLPKEQFSFIGNSSVLGAYMALVSKNHREKLLSLAQKITYIDLGETPGYMDQYTAALFLPHTDSRLFPKQ